MTTPRSNRLLVWFVRQTLFTNCGVFKSFWRGSCHCESEDKNRRPASLMLSSENIFVSSQQGSKVQMDSKPCLLATWEASASCLGLMSPGSGFSRMATVHVWRQPGERCRDDLIQYSRQDGGGFGSCLGVPFGLMAGLLFKFFSRMSIAKCTTESSTTFLVEGRFPDSAARQCSCSPMSSSSSETVKFQHWSGLPSPLIWTRSNMYGTTSVGEYILRIQRLYLNSSGYRLTSRGRALKTSSAALQPEWGTHWCDSSESCVTLLVTSPSVPKALLL